MKKCPGFFSLPRKTRYIVDLIPSTFSASMRLFYILPLVALNVDGIKCPICPNLLGSEEKQGNKIEDFT